MQNIFLEIQVKKQTCRGLIWAKIQVQRNKSCSVPHPPSLPSMYCIESHLKPTAGITCGRILAKPPTSSTKTIDDFLAKLKPLNYMFITTDV